MIKKIAVYWDNFFYKKILKNFLKISKLGHGFIEEGAESGTHFEHIYNNKPQGKYLIGKYVDKILLNLPSVKATRGRKDEIKKILWNEIQNHRLKNKITRIVDIASGGARYLREIAREGCDNVEIMCIDKSKDCVKLGNLLCKQEKLTKEKIKFFRGNIFKLKHLYRLSHFRNWHPDIIIASGLLIYFNDEMARRILSEIKNQLIAGGMVIFQSYENLSSKKLMRKTMSTSNGQAWTLYYRKPEFWRELLCSLGYEDIFIYRDQWQMNNICSARKPK